MLTFKQTMNSDHKELLELVQHKIHFGKYKGWFLCDLPEAYLLWFKRNGFPKGKLGKQLELLLEMRMNGLEHLFPRLKQIK